MIFGLSDFDFANDNPDSIAALHNKSVLQAKNGFLNKAEELNRRVLVLAPGWKPALDFKKRLQNARNKREFP